MSYFLHLLCYISISLPGTQVFLFVCPEGEFGWRSLNSKVTACSIHILRLRFCGKYLEVSAKYHQTVQCSPECLPELQMEASGHKRLQAKYHIYSNIRKIFFPTPISSSAKLGSYKHSQIYSRLHRSQAPGFPHD